MRFSYHSLVFLIGILFVRAGLYGNGTPAPLASSGLESQMIQVVLPQGKTCVAGKVQSNDLGSGSFSWSGRLTGADLGFLSFARIGNYLNGTVTFANGPGYSFKGPHENLAWTQGFGHAKTCGGCKFEQGLPPDPRSAAQPLQSWRNGDANLVDLLVVYPSAVRSEAGDTNAVEAAIASAVADANLCYRNSLVPTQLRVVHMAEVTYTPTGLLSTDLDRLKNPSDGSMDNVHTLRNQYGADLVSLLTTTSDSGGLASMMTHPRLSFESSGFNVNVWDQLGAPSYTLAHEIGHNMGCMHNREDSTWDSDYELSAFSFGKRWLQGGQGYRTIMSYDSDPAAYGNRIPFFSNPDLSYLGTTVGNAGTEDNAQVLSITVPYVSNFRISKVQALLPTVFDLQVPEGNSSSFKVRLTVKPTVAVDINVSVSGDSDLFISSPTNLTFDSENWNIAQTIQVSAQADSDSANGTSTLTLSANGISSSSVQLAEVESGTSLESNFLVAGVVRNDLRMGLSGVSLTLSNGGGTLQSDSNGTFRAIMNSGWTGTITPSRAGYTFTPSSITVGTLGTNSVGHEFSATRSSILYVDKDATGAGDGTSWTNAYVDLGQALISQNSFTEVWVAEGTYLPGAIRPSSFLLPPNVQVYGGFSGNETSRAQRNVVTNPTILSGDIGTQANSSDNSYHVVVPSQGSTLDGFTIKDGNASKNFSNDDRGIGAGLYADEATFVVSNCIFIDNRSRQRGGAVYLKDCNATFVDCNFTNNKGTAWGNGNGYAGAIYASGGRLILQSTSFTSNSADFEGGAIFAENTDLNSTNCVFSGNQNTVNNGGGAIRVDGGSLHDLNGTFTSNTSASSGGAIRVSNVSMSLTHSSFTSNQAAFSGGAIRSVDSNFTTHDCTFSLNSSTGSGGGAIEVENGSFQDANGSYSNNSAGLGGGAMRWTNTTGSIQDSNFTENQNPTSNGGGAFYLSNASPGFSNCRFTRNGTLANNYGGAVKMLSSSSSFSNCIFTGNYNQGNSGGAVYADGSSSPTFTNNEFRFNHSVQLGGAIFAECNLNLAGGLFLGNYADSGGGVATQGSVSCSFSNIRILGNESNSSGSSSGGFAYFNTGSTGSTFVNCVISGNKSLGRNGVYKPTGATRFVNCSIVGNQSATEGGIALLFTGDSIAVDNSILWGNTATTGNEIHVNTGTASANYSLYNPAQSVGSISGSNNLNNDPLFSDANGTDNVYGTEDDDLTIQSSSPAIDQASASVANYMAVDLLGRSRFGNPDLGAYEYLPPPAGTIAITSPVGNADQHADLNVSITYQSGGGGNQTPTWAYRIDSPFPGYASPHGGTQVTGPTSVNDFLSGQPNGSKHVYVALLDQNGDLHNPPVIDDTFINYTYQTPGGGSSRLQASVFGTGGSVSLNPNNPDGMYEYDSNVTVTAVADPHFEFVSWTGAGVTQPTSPTSTVVMTEDRNVTATFKVREYFVTIATVGTGTFTGVGVYPFDSNVSISATAGQGYEFSHWLNYDSLGNLTTGLDNNLTANTTLNVGGGHALVAVFNPLKYNIAVNSTSGGSAQVVQQPGPYDFDGNYTLAASVNYGYSFSNWTGDSNSIALLPSVNTSITPFLLTHPGNLSYTANFTENQYLLTVLYGTGGASVSPATPANYKHSDIVPISATALHGYEFDQWEDTNGSLVDFTQLNTDANMSKNAADVTARALFKAKQYDVNLTAGPGGQVTITPTTGPWEHFSVYPVLATPSTGYAFSGWTGDVNSTNSLTDGVSDANNSLAISGPVTLTASFALIDFNVTATVGTGSGNVTGSGTYTVNDTPQVVAVAGTGWHFTSWSGDTFALNSPSSLSSTINLLLHPQNLSLQANFARNTFDVNVTTTGGGLVNGQAALSLNPAYEDVIDLNATPSTGWEFDNWFGHANSNDWNASVSLSVTSNLDLNATFKRKDYALNIQSAANGQTSGEGSHPFESNVTIVAIPSTGYLFTSWTGDVQYLADPNASTTIVTIPSSDVNIAPAFSPKTHQVTVTSDANGSATGGGSYTFGSIATLTATGNGPDIGNLAGYEFSQWTLTNQAGGESNSSSNPLSLTVDGNYSIFAYFAPIQAGVHDLNLSVSPTGSGIVFDDPNLRVWNGGTLILTSNITVTPNPGYSFLGWSNPDNKTITPNFKSPTITFVTNESASLVAQFVKNIVDTNIRTTGSGSVQTESNETSLSLQATANTGYTFQNWDVDHNFTYAVTMGNSSVDPSSQVFQVNGKESPSLTLIKGYTYTFACNTGSDGFYLSTQIDSTGFSNEYTDANLTGSRTTSGNLVFTVPNDFDTNVTLYYCSSQTPFAGNSIKVTDAIPDATIVPFPTQATITPTITHDLSAKATFNLNQYLVTISAGNGGSLTQGTTGTYYHGDSVSLSATPDAHYVFSHWEGADFASASSATTSTTISSDATIQAVFTPVIYTLTLSKNLEAGGDVFTTTNVYQFNYNEIVTIQAQPRAGYVFLSWSNGLSNATEQITILGDTSLSANFDGEPATLTHLVQTHDVDDSIIQGVSGGFISVSANPPYKFGDSIEMTSHDEPGFQFDGWLDTNSELISSSRTLQLSLEANQTITAKFKKLSYEVKIFSAPLVGGTVKADRGTNSQIQTIYVPHGEQVNLQALASANYQFEKWVGNGLESANIFNSQLELTVTQDLSVTGHFIPLQPIELAIVITSPVGNADQNTDLQVSVTYQSGGGGNQTPTWAYRIDSPFPGYGSPHGGTQVTGPTSVNDFLSGQPNGSKHVYVALLDSNDFLHNPPVTADSWINYQYQTPANMWTNATNLGNGWKNLSWFGNYFEGNSDWIFHETLGWVYRAASSLQSSWLYHNGLGWVWTDSSVYPYLFSDNKGGWVYLHHPGAGQDPRYYDYTSDNWQDFTGGPGYAASDYNSSSTYQTGSLVRVGTSSYFATQSVPSFSSPPNTTYWINLSVAMSALSTPVEAVPTLSTQTILNSLPGSQPATNQAPFGLGSASQLTIAENRPLQSVVGILTASDPDANDSLSFSLVNGGADSPFAIDVNGSVRTTRSLDFELHPIHQLFFRATDNHGAFAEGNLTVRVIDVFQPITETMEAMEVTSISANLQGSVLDDGGAPVTSYGFLISTKPQLDNDLNGTSVLLAGGESTKLSALATNLQADKKYFYRVFATNAEGTSFGSVETFVTTAGPLSPNWIEAQPGTAKDWWSSPWFGNFYLNANGWARHEKLGWVFPMESPTAGLWLWKEGMGWLWTDRGIYPFLYDNNGGGWLYFYGQHEGTKLFYDYVRKKWTTLKEN